MDEQVKDPVCGMVRPKSQMKAQALFGGKVYYFCAEEHKKMFESDPEKWVPKGA